MLGPLLGKRPASSPKSPSRLFVTPKKPRPSYSGPMVDPNPVNPFSATPPKPPPPTFPSLIASSAAGSSPFLHASSPRKLKELLESNSLKKVRERHDEITPRTKARLRLAGDFVTPMKDKEPLKRRGERGNPSASSRPLEMLGEDVGEAEDDEGEDEFGPSPMRPGLNRTFTELLQSSAEEVKPKIRSRGKDKEGSKVQAGSSKQRDLRVFFGMAPGRRKTDSTRESPPRIVAIAASPPHAGSFVDADGVETLSAGVDQQANAAGSDGRLVHEVVDGPVTPPPGLETYAAPTQTPSRSVRKEKYVSFSDDEVDEWDPEGGNVRQRVFITGTKRNAVRRDSLSSMSGEERDESGHAAGAEEEEEEGDEDEDETEAESNGVNGNVQSIDGVTVSLEHEIRVGDTAVNGLDGANGAIEEDDGPASKLSLNGPTSPTSSTRSSAVPALAPAPLPLLSLLSLRSPPSRNSSRMNDLRVKAIFNPSHAARLKAVQRGQDIVSGEANLQSDEDEEGLLDTYENGEVDGEDGDDDWDEDCDGWKGATGAMDDEAW